MFKKLGHKCKRARTLRALALRSAQRASRVPSLLRLSTRRQSDIEDMIWEVDDDCDKRVTWPEFQSMFTRCRNDKTGYEPRRLYNVAEFLMNDKDGNGNVSVEEVMQILFLRYGRQLLDSQLEELFGTSDTNSGTRDLSLTAFLASLNASQAKQLRAKEQSKAKPEPAEALSARRR